MARQGQSAIVIVGGGPAGLAAALAAAEAGAQAILVDENAAPGGQLRKQIHKFFGSREHHAGIRGYHIAEQMIEDCRAAGVQLLSEAVVFSLRGTTVGLTGGLGPAVLEARAVILATGASENALAFPGSTLPGVMGAGAAQTFANLHRVLPGRRILMVGGGNVGLIVAYQLLQAGAEVVGVVEAAPRLGGYAVHAAKIKRAGVPIFLGHTVLGAAGDGQVEEVTLAAVDARFRPIPGSERTLATDTICLSVGLSPLAELAWQAGCALSYLPALGGHVPLHSSRMETTLPNVFIAGDIAGVEEASTALEEGSIAGLAAAAAAGCSVEPGRFAAAEQRLAALRSGPFGCLRQKAKEDLQREWANCRRDG